MLYIAQSAAGAVGFALYPVVTEALIALELSTIHRLRRVLICMDLFLAHHFNIGEISTAQAVPRSHIAV